MSSLSVCTCVLCLRPVFAALCLVLQEAKTLELDNTKTRQAEAVVDRGRIVQETVDKLTRACAKFDLDALNEVSLHLHLHNVCLSCA
jgi:hypothetical protein